MAPYPLGFQRDCTKLRQKEFPGHARTPAPCTAPPSLEVIRAQPRSFQIGEVTDALAYLHRNSTRHGDIRAVSLNFITLDCELNIPQANVMVTADRHALLTGFASSALSDPTGWTEELGIAPMRWLSPEILGEGEDNNLASDVWAWGCLVVEV